MRALQPFLHGGAKPIGVHEFMDALQATCPPRFPHARAIYHRPVGLAISGGVDSMALAYLCSRVRLVDPWFKISDAPLGGFVALVVDHGLREGSYQEAVKVRQLLAGMGHRAQVWSLKWADEIGPGVDPNSLPNLEAVARRLRYRCFGLRLSQFNIVSLLLAHHEDDQYETVLMRMIAGHGPRGLRGIRAANDIPECYDMHGTYQSGFLDDQRSAAPYVTLQPSRRVRRTVKFQLRDEMDPEMLSEEIAQGLRGDMDPLAGADEEADRDSSRGRRANRAPALAPLDTEDLGVMLYRPLLQFSKDRLIATCLENKVSWFEDHTNKDPTLTPRNALRYIYTHFELPRALQKPAILALAERCNRTASQQEAEAERLASRCLIRKFEPNVGTVIVRLPSLRVRVRRKASMYSAAWQRKRREHYKTVAALLVQKLLGLVTPETHVTPIANLQGAVAKLFPLLAEAEEQGDADGVPPRATAYSICGVHFVPVHTHTAHARGGPLLHWYLTRAPHTSPSRVPLPTIKFPTMPLIFRRGKAPHEWRWPAWSDWNLYDGRFWVRVRNRLPYYAKMMPFDREHAKPFREALADDRARDDLAALLKEHAPGKVRYTLPALYVAGNVDWALNGGPYWPEPQGLSSSSVSSSTSMSGLRGDDGPEAQAHEEMRRWEKAEREERGELRLVALPTLGVYVPGIEQWLQWEVTYRKVDRAMLERSQFDATTVAGAAAARETRPRRLFGPWSRRRKANAPLAETRLGSSGSSSSSSGSSSGSSSSGSSSLRRLPARMEECTR